MGGSTILVLMVLAASGTVVDLRGGPIEGAEVCLTTQRRPLFCSTTDENGFWRLPDSAAEGIRITKSGYLSATIAVATQEAPLVLKAAAGLRVRVVDASGAPVAAGTLTLVYTSGRRIGPLPFNRAGMRNPSLEPGEVRVVAEAEGFVVAEAGSATLEAGVEREVIVRMTKR